MNDLMKLMRTGRIAEAKALIEAQKAKTVNSPTRIVAKTGQPTKFYRGNKRVEPNADGTWRMASTVKDESV